MSLDKVLLGVIMCMYTVLAGVIGAQLWSWFTTDPTTPPTTAPVATDPNVAPLPTDTETIPRILLDNLRYQQAAVGEQPFPPESYTTDAEAALVNLLCRYTTADSVRTTTGSGFFIGPNGVILTNAHVAQFLLLETLTDAPGTTECLVRAGDPATPQYEAELLYMPPAWIQAHAADITATSPTGTGERDYALLYVSDSVSSTPLPARFPALRSDISLLPRQIVTAPVTAAGYPAGARFRDADAYLAPDEATTTIAALYTFGSNVADVIALRGSTLGTHGASGGPVVNDTGDAIGLISTRGDDAQHGSGSLRAITLSYIDRTIQEETGFTLTETIQGDVRYRAQVFRETLAPFLTAMLREEL